eukprot:1309293-Heterocapsa_arctica.AAC.1
MSDATQFRWVLMRPMPDCIRPIRGQDGDRALPAGVRKADMNWLCAPPGEHKWVPTLHQLMFLHDTARGMLRTIEEN